MNPTKKKKKEKIGSVITTTFQLQGESLAEQYITNTQIMKHLKQENEKISEQLMELMLFRGVPRKLELVVSNNQPTAPFLVHDKFSMELIDRRETAPNVIGAIKVLIKSAFKKYLPNVTDDMRKKFTAALATTLATFLRKDAVMISALKTTKWGAKYIEQLETKPYFTVKNKEGGYE